MKSLAFNIDCIPGMKNYPDLYFDFAIVDIEYGIGASKPTSKPDFVKQKNGNKISILCRDARGKNCRRVSM